MIFGDKVVFRIPDVINFPLVEFMSLLPRRKGAGPGGRCSTSSSLSLLLLLHHSHLALASGSLRHVLFHLKQVMIHLNQVSKCDDDNL